MLLADLDPSLAVQDRPVARNDDRYEASTRDQGRLQGLAKIRTNLGEFRRGGRLGWSGGGGAGLDGHGGASWGGSLPMTWSWRIAGKLHDTGLVTQ